MRFKGTAPLGGRCHYPSRRSCRPTCCICCRRGDARRLTAAGGRAPARGQWNQAMLFCLKPGAAAAQAANSCAATGGTWANGNCTPSPETACEQGGGTWDPTNGCTSPQPAAQMPANQPSGYGPGAGGGGYGPGGGGGGWSRREPECGTELRPTDAADDRSSADE